MNEQKRQAQRKAKKKAQGRADNEARKGAKARKRRALIAAVIRERMLAKEGR